jgi:hypothetical protein
MHAWLLKYTMTVIKNIGCISASHNKEKYKNIKPLFLEIKTDNNA